MVINKTKAVATIIQAVSPVFTVGATVGRADVCASIVGINNRESNDVTRIFLFILN